MIRRGLRIELRLPPEWDRIELVRQGLALTVQSVFDDDGLGESLSMASAELLENAVKYGARAGGTVDLSVSEDEDAVWVHVTNAIDPGSDHASLLASRIAWIRSYDDPSEAYTAALGALFQNADFGCEQSGLGLARIAHEGRGALECDTTVVGRVTVRARFTRRCAVDTVRPVARPRGEPWDSKLA